jgi:uncharacterized membrane protein YoaK (UPF0700 family)
MGGKRSDWLRWFLVLAGLVLGLRIGVLLALPILPDAFAWGSAMMLGTALTFFLLPLPHEATLVSRVDPPAPVERDAE